MSRCCVCFIYGLIVYFSSGVALSKEAVKEPQKEPQTESLTLGWNDFPPYSWKDEQGEIQGFDIEVATAILEEAGFEVVLKKMPWNRIVQIGLKNGEIDVAMSASYTQEREKEFYFSNSEYYLSDVTIFIRKRDKEKLAGLKRLSDISNFDISVGVTRGYIYSETYQSLLKNPDFSSRLIETAQEKQNIKMLMTGRVDAIIGNHLSISHIISELDQANDITPHVYLELSGEDQGSFMMFSKFSVTQNQLDRVNKALARLKNKGVIKNIGEKYVYKDTL